MTLVPLQPSSSSPSPTTRGRAAEAQAADYLRQHGFTILNHNWRNRWCELDLVARRADTIHIIEVKYRRTTTWGSGFDAITSDKIRRLQHAALAWTQAHAYSGPYQIDIISLTGDLAAPRVDYLPNALTD